MIAGMDVIDDDDANDGSDAEDMEEDDLEEMEHDDEDEGEREYDDYDIDDSVVDGLCEALRCNDPSVTSIDALHVGRNRLQDLFDALQHSTFVTTLKVSIKRFLEAPIEATNAMLTFTETSQVLRDVQVFSDDSYATLFTPPYRNTACDDIGSRIVNAVLANPHIESFLPDTSAPPHLLASLLKQTLSIKHLSIYTDPLHYAASHPVIAGALAENRSLLSLELQAQMHGEIAPTLVQHLRFHPTLRDLQLHLLLDEASIPLSEAIASLLRSTSVLQNLELTFCNFDATHFDLVFAPLKRPNNQRSLTRLSLGYGNFDEQATASLIDFVQNHANTGSNVLRELCLEGSEKTFSGTTMGKVAAEMLINSSLEVLRIERSEDGDIVDFFEGLQRNSSQVHLSSLQLHRLGSAEFDAMVGYLRVSANLRHMSILGLVEDVKFSTLLAVLRSNGTLQQFTVEDDDFWTQVGAHQIGAVCQRNRCLPELFGTPSRTSDSIARKDWTLFPTLCACAQQARATAIQNMLIGLVAFGD
jgi:hypothetical protein